MAESETGLGRRRHVPHLPKRVWRPGQHGFSFKFIGRGGLIFSDGTELEGDRVIAIPASQLEANSDNSVGGPITLIL